MRERPQLAAALAAAKKHKARLIVSRMDRLARDARTLLELIDAGVDIAFVDLPQIPRGRPGTSCSPLWPPSPSWRPG